MAMAPPADWIEDPTGRFSLRYWDGAGYTDWVLGFNGQVVQDPFLHGPAGAPGSARDAAAVDGEAVVDEDTSSTAYQDLEGRKSVPDMPVDEVTVSEDAPPSSQSVQNQAAVPPTVRPAATSTTTGGFRPQTTGDAVLSFINKVTLNSMIDRRLANAFWLPPLLDLVRERPDDPRTMMWLGIRLQEFERTRSRMRSANMPVSVAGAVLRPVLRPAMRAAASAMSSGDGKPASQKVLSRAWQQLEVRLRNDAPHPSVVCLMARNYLAAEQPTKAWELAAVATQVQPPRAEAAYILAEAMFAYGDHAQATTWAHHSTELGCTLGHSLLRRDTPFRREAWTTTRPTRVMPTVADFWKAKARYYEGASPEQLFHFFGPSPLTHATGATP